MENGGTWYPGKDRGNIIVDILWPSQNFMFEEATI